MLAPVVPAVDVAEVPVVVEMASLSQQIHRCVRMLAVDTDQRQDSLGKEEDRSLHVINFPTHYCAVEVAYSLSGSAVSMLLGLMFSYRAAAQVLKVGLKGCENMDRVKRYRNCRWYC